MSGRRFFGTGLPGVNASELKGKLIVIEGADGSGRSTQIAILKEWLEKRGYGVVDVGLRRSTLVSAQLEKAKQGNILGPVTFSLFYATDFADQLENKIVPALKAGFIVLADRYIYTLMARDVVRGADPDWVANTYDIAVIPDVVFYLKVSPRVLVDRNFSKKAALDYWESGMDIGLSRDMFESFLHYQAMIQREFKRLQGIHGFQVISGNRSPKSVSKQIQAKIEELLVDQE